MKINNDYLFFLIIILLFICYHSNIENYENIYQNNDILSDEPDDIQFYSCEHAKYEEDINYPFEKYPNSNYKLKRNSVKHPLKGTFSSFIDTNKLRTYDNFYHSPICENTYPFDTDYKSQFRDIIQEEDNISVLIDKEKYKDSHSLHNPYYLYGNPNYIQNKIIYDEDIQDIFLKAKHELPKHHEDDSHLVNDHNYDI